MFRTLAAILVVLIINLLGIDVVHGGTLSLIPEPSRCVCTTCIQSGASVGAVAGSYDLYIVGMHEVGHALNKAHVWAQSMMQPVYQEGYIGLQPNDIFGLTDLYGPAEGFVPATEGTYTVGPGAVWPYNEALGTTRITYALSPTLDLFLPDGYREFITYAMEDVMAVANILFVEVPWMASNPYFGDIRISAAEIDGPGGTLAYAYYPPPNEEERRRNPLYGDIIFDSSESWVLYHPTPEPATATLAVVGILLLAGARMRRRAA